LRRRRFLLIAGAGLLASAAGLIAAEEGKPRRIAVSAKKFEFSPNEIRLKKGERVVFELTALDFPHGFSVPDFGVRRDFLPGQVIELAFTADRAGRFQFLCDNFCGEGHDGMSGFLVVT
jgi:cytochrome c oxidase subunit 2